MDHSGNIHRNALKRPRLASLDDEPDRPPPQYPDGTHRTQTRVQLELPLTQDPMISSVASVGHTGSAASCLTPSQSSSEPLTLATTALSITNESYFLGGTHIENTGTLTINHVYNQSSSPPPGAPSAQLDQSATTNAIRPSPATAVENQGIPMPVTSTSTRQHLRTLVQALKPSSKAHYKYYPEGQQSQLLRRTTCTEGTRVRILEAVSTWVNDTSDSAESVYWLFGLAGSGKSTIACTIATRTEQPTSSTTLGANFFCSRQFDETRYSKRIVPTVAYHLAQQCPSFADALSKRDFGVVHQSPRDQLEELLAKPWVQSVEARGFNPCSPQSYLVIIDALDEIEAEGGTDFLHSLLDMINDQHLPGLKFFVTSRPNPTIVRHVESFGDKKIYRLEEIPIEEAEADIETYLNAMLPDFKGSNLLRQLIQLAAGLFIFAATVVKQLTVRNQGPKEQLAALKKFISVSTRTGPASTSSATQALDAVYIQVLTEAFADLDDDVFASRLRILHAFLCAMEPTSAAVMSSLLQDDADEDSDEEFIFKDDPAFSSEVVANNVINDLYSVLYFQNGKVFPYHKSFLDFVFDQDRSGRFWCDESALHHTLAISCFRIMSKGLRFNIANIPSSYVLDRDNPRLQDEAHLAKSIPLDLRYACTRWARQLAETDGLDDSETTPLVTSLADFIHLPALFWIEAMNILGQGTFCAPDLLTASHWVPSDDLASALDEAARFALYFSNSPASSSTPHLYISALVTWRHTAYPVSNWKIHFPNTPRFTSGPAEFALITIDTRSSAQCVAISPSGEVIANGTNSGLVQVWDATNGKPVVHFGGHEGTVESISFFKDDTRIATSSSDKTVRIWEVETPKELQVFRGHHGTVHAAAISPDETRIVSGHEDGFVLLWDVDTGNLVRAFEGHTGPVTSVGFSYSPAMQICSGSRDCTVRVWDVASGQILPNGVLREHHSAVVGVAFSSVDHSMVSFGEDGVVWKWDPVTLSGKRFTECESEVPYLAKGSLSIDGLRIVLVDYNVPGVEIRDSRTGELLRMFHGVSWDAVLSRDGAFGVTVLSNGLIQVWDAVVDAVVDEPHEEPPESVPTGPLAVSHDATKIVSSDWSASGTICICIWDAKTGDLLHKSKGSPTRVVSTVFSEDDHTIFLLEDKTLGRWDWPTGNSSTVAKVAYDGKLVEAAFSQGGSRVIYLDDANNVDVYDLSTGKTLHLNKHEHPVSAVALSWDGGYAALGTKEGEAVVWDISSGEAIRRWVLDSEGWITAMSFSYDSSWLACVDFFQVHIWDVATEDLLMVLDRGDTGRRVSGLAFSPDGSILASAYLSRSITLWDTQTWEVLDSLEGFTDDIESLTFSPNGKQVISVEGGVIRVWNVPPSAATVDPKGYRVEKKIDVSSGLPVCSRTGWLLEANTDDRIICLPQNNMVPDPSNILVLPPSTKDTSVSYSHTTLGPNWELCYAGPSLPSTGQ